MAYSFNLLSLVGKCRQSASMLWYPPCYRNNSLVYTSLYTSAFSFIPPFSAIIIFLHYHLYLQLIFIISLQHASARPQQLQVGLLMTLLSIQIKLSMDSNLSSLTYVQYWHSVVTMLALKVSLCMRLRFCLGTLSVFSGYYWLLVIHSPTQHYTLLISKHCTNHSKIISLNHFLIYNLSAMKFHQVLRLYVYRTPKSLSPGMT